MARRARRASQDRTTEISKKPSSNRGLLSRPPLSQNTCGFMAPRKPSRWWNVPLGSGSSISTRCWKLSCRIGPRREWVTALRLGATGSRMRQLTSLTSRAAMSGNRPLAGPFFIGELIDGICRDRPADLLPQPQMPLQAQSAGRQSARSLLRPWLSFELLLKAMPRLRGSARAQTRRSKGLQEFQVPPCFSRRI